MELLHTATLLHDDVVDFSELRRGRPSANALWGNRRAVLGGDFFYARASSMIVEDGNLDILWIFADTIRSMAEGELLQLERSFDPTVTEAHYFSVIERKSAVLLSAACEAGAILGDVSRAPSGARWPTSVASWASPSSSATTRSTTRTGEAKLGKRPVQRPPRGQGDAAPAAGPQALHPGGARRRSSAVLKSAARTECDGSDSSARRSSDLDARHRHRCERYRGVAGHPAPRRGARHSAPPRRIAPFPDGLRPSAI